MSRFKTALQRLQQRTQQCSTGYWIKDVKAEFDATHCFFQPVFARASVPLLLTGHIHTISSKSTGDQRQPNRDYELIDRLRVQARGGQGGNGSVSLWRSSAKGKFTPADGGNGGKGGDVVLRATVNAKSLAHLSRSLNGARGAAGGPQKRHGAVGRAVVVDVPLGTVVYNSNPDDYEQSVTTLNLETGARSSPANNASAAVRLAEAQPSRQQPQYRPRRLHDEQSDSEALPSENLSFRNGLSAGNNRASRPSASDGLSFASPDLSFSPRSVVHSKNSDLSAVSGNFDDRSFTSAASHDSNNNSPVSDDCSKNRSRANPQLIHQGDGVDGLAFATPDLSFSTWSVVTNGDSLTQQDGNGHAQDPRDSIEDGGSDTGVGGILFSSPDLSFSAWDVASPRAASCQAAGQTVDDHESPSRINVNEKEHYNEANRMNKASYHSKDDSKAYFPAAAAGRHGSCRSASSKGGNSTTSLAIGSEQEPPHQLDPPQQPVALGSRAQLDSLPVLADLVEEGQEVVVARGGRGGRGNATYRTRPNTPASKRHESGEPGQTARLVLEMKLLADVGLVGFPNAGKSTLLRGVSRAYPAVASYPFTTLQPQLGTVQFSDGASFTVADIPGLIEGAHANRGLGHAFLRHIQRTRALVFVVDLGGFSFRDAPPMSPIRQLELLRRELRQYDPSLLTIPAVVAANKSDKLLPPAVHAELEHLRSRTDLLVLPVSGKMQQGLSTLCNSLLSMVGSNSQ